MTDHPDTHLTEDEMTTRRRQQLVMHCLRILAESRGEKTPSPLDLAVREPIAQKAWKNIPSDHLEATVRRAIWINSPEGRTVENVHFVWIHRNQDLRPSAGEIERRRRARDAKAEREKAPEHIASDFYRSVQAQLGAQ